MSEDSSESTVASQQAACVCGCCGEDLSGNDSRKMSCSCFVKSLECAVEDFGSVLLGMGSGAF